MSLQVKKIVKKLRHNYRPLITFGTAPVFFDIYVVKKMGKHKWENQYAYQLLCKARRSYLIYGGMPLIDAYDEKSAIYLVCVRYAMRVLQSTKEYFLPIEEWFSMRFIPGFGNPAGTSDFEEIQNPDFLKHRIKDQFTLSYQNVVDHIVTISKICKIPPYIVSERRNYNSTTQDFLGRLNFSALSFAYCFAVFFEENGDKFEFIMGLFRRELIDKKLTLRIGPSEKLPEFTSAHRMLDLPTPITINRSHEAYKYPAYFFQMEELLNLFKKLLQNKYLTEKTITRYCNGYPCVSDILSIKRQSLHRFKNLGNLLAANGLLYGSSITGELLRGILDKKVSDGPELQLMRMKEWSKSIEKVVESKYLVPMIY